MFSIGDGAEDPYWGFAQTVLHQGRYVAKSILNKRSGRKKLPISLGRPLWRYPLGSDGQLCCLGLSNFTADLVGWLRKLGNFRFFISIFSFQKTLEIVWDKVGLNSVEGLEKYLETSPLPEEIRIQTENDVTLPKKTQAVLNRRIHAIMRYVVSVSTKPFSYTLVIFDDFY